MRKGHRWIGIVLGAAGLGLAACGDEDPGPQQPTPTLANSWPNDDGRFWSYRMTQREWAQEAIPYYDSAAAVPAVSLDLAASLLASHAIGDSVLDRVGTLQLQFRDSITTGPGVRAQNLVETVVLPPPADPRLASAGGFWSRLAHARPDLASRIERLRDAGTLDEVAGGDAAPLLLQGGAWEKSLAYIGAYADLDRDLSWKYLTAALTPGSEFVHQLIPSIADDVFLRARVLRWTPVTTTAGTFQNAVECLYLIDYGVLEVVDVEGHTVGFARAFDYGTVTYAPNVGPVACYERQLVSIADPPTSGWGDQRLDLTGTGLPVR